ncbi:GNAT family N-acetyltransferase [Auraticoccus monumenti]|uniref:Ribosomal protein S18 acetylase RimI n=1 Tax=Auraticoccus monumenti TaxID=675864 RepID=A0A1G7B7M0_9ACTN|nr:GNAT family N-acetyltransferase [Auraticoccus monumenti]SDE22962.1 Ribosomal protein S18 acetylase RimI [Auraticoccus monumenti]
MGHALDEVTPLRWRPVGPEDVAVVHELLAEIERHDDPAERHTVEELQANLPASCGDAASHTVLGFDGGSAVALGWNILTDSRPGYHQVFLSGGVHPSWRQLGIGRRLLAWQIRQAGSHVSRRHGDGQCLVVAHSDEKSTGRLGLYRRLGLVPVRRHLDLFRALSDDLPPLVVPPEVELVPWSAERSEDVRAAHNDAFADVYRARPVTTQEWDAWRHRPTARPEWSWLAVETAGREVVGYAISSGDPSEWEAQGFSQGWTEWLGVRRSWRRRGLARALLVRSMRSFADAGLQAAGLGVDTLRVGGPLEPYHSLGYRVADSVIRHEVAVADGTGPAS